VHPATTPGDPSPRSAHSLRDAVESPAICADLPDTINRAVLGRAPS
jgi:hypothetical protein